MTDSQTRMYRDTFTGLVGPATEDQYSAQSYRLLPVADDAKPYVEGMFKPGFVGEYDNPEPPTDAELAAQADLDAALEDGAPNSKAAREAKAKLKAAEEQAEADAEAARREAEDVVTAPAAAPADTEGSK